MATPVSTYIRQINVQGTNTPEEAKGAAINVIYRSLNAKIEHPEIFNDPIHISRTQQARRIIEKALPVNNGVYINHRAGGRGRKPCSVVKVAAPKWPYMSREDKRKKILLPLAAIDAVLIENKTNGTVLIHIY